MIDKSKLSECFRKYSPWLAVFTGAYAIFAYSVLNEFPKPIQQAIGARLVTYCTQEAALRIAVAILAGRLVVLWGREVLFGMLRVVTMQLPLRVAKYLKGRVRRFLIRTIGKYRKFMDLLYALLVRVPNESSLLFASAIYFYWLSDSWRLVMGFFLFTMYTLISAEFAEETKDAKMALRFRFKNLLDDTSQLRQLSYSSAVLLVAFLAGAGEARKLIKDAELSTSKLNGGTIVFVTQDVVLTVTEKSEDQREWHINPMKNTPLSVND